MKIFIKTCCLFILCLSFKVAKAQSEQSEPTKQDALDFLNKVAKEYPAKYHTDESSNPVPSTAVFTLDGCVLTKTVSFSYITTGARGVADFRYITTINLASVYYSDLIIKQSVQDDIYAEQIVKFFKSNGKERTDMSSDKSFNWDQLNILGEIDDESTQFKDSHYYERLWSAVVF
jgi:hypothetical protein